MIVLHVLCNKLQIHIFYGTELMLQKIGNRMSGGEFPNLHDIFYNFICHVHVAIQKKQPKKG